MADTSGMADIRGIDVDKLAKGFADEEFIFRNFVTQSTTSAREVRWYKKTSGVLDSTDTTGITASQIINVSHLALPVVIEQSWTRNTSYVRKFFVESPWISEEDIKDSDIDILATNVRDITRAVLKQLNDHIYNTMTENQSAVDILSTASTAAWNAGSGQDPIKDINTGIRKIRIENYEPTHLFLSPLDFDSLLTWLISTKGASIPSFSSNKLVDGTVMEILGLRVVVSNSVAADSAAIAAPQRAVTLKEFMPVTAVTKLEEGIGRKIRVWWEGVALLTDPKCVHLITNTQA